MTPSDIEILIHCHVCPEPHPRSHAPAVQQSIEQFVIDDILKPKDNSYITTARGDALVRMLCNTELPQQAWIDKDGNVILRTVYKEVDCAFK